MEKAAGYTGEYITDKDRIKEILPDISTENILGAGYTEDDGYFEVSTDPDVFGAVCAALEEKGYKIESAEVLRVPQTTVTLTSEDDLKNMTKLIDMLDDNDDVQNVFHNCDIPDEE